MEFKILGRRNANDVAKFKEEFKDYEFKILD